MQVSHDDEPIAAFQTATSRCGWLNNRLCAMQERCEVELGIVWTSGGLEDFTGWLAEPSLVLDARAM